MPNFHENGIQRKNKKWIDENIHDWNHLWASPIMCIL